MVATDWGTTVDGFAFKPNSTRLEQPSATLLRNRQLSVAFSLMMTSSLIIQGILQINGVMVCTQNDASGSLVVADSGGGNQSGTAGSGLLALNLWYRIGIRIRNDATSADFFINGVKAPITGTTTNITPAAGITQIAGCNVAGQRTLVGFLRDVRVWDAAMPDATFERYYVNPWAFYTRSRPVFKAAAGGAGGRLLPFLHPSLQS